MIRVTIEMLPGGDEDAAYPMHVITIANDVLTSLVNSRKGSYRYKISRKIQEGRKISWVKEGVVHNFPRANKNSVKLLLAILDDAYGGKNETPRKENNVDHTRHITRASNQGSLEIPKRRRITRRKQRSS